MTDSIVRYKSSPIHKKIGKVFSGKCAEKNICPVKDILAKLSDKWSMHCILLLGQYNKMRFSELKTGIEGISQRMLTVTLRSLEEDGIVLRILHTEIPPKVEYELTDLGKGLLIQLLALATWADENSTEIIKARKRYSKKLVVS